MVKKGIVETVGIPITTDSLQIREKKVLEYVEKTIIIHHFKSQQEASVYYNYLLKRGTHTIERSKNEGDL